MATGLAGGIFVRILTGRAVAMTVSVIL